MMFCKMRFCYYYFKKIIDMWIVIVFKFYENIIYFDVFYLV